MSSYYYGHKSPCVNTCKTCCPDGSNDATAQSSDTCCGGTYTGSCDSCNSPVGSRRGGSSSVLLSSGMFSFKRDLLAISAINGVSWGFGLDYLAQQDVNGFLGKSFNYPQNLRLEPAAPPLPSSDVELWTGQNTSDVFTSTGSGTYAPAVDNTTRATLTRTDMGTSSDQFSLVSSAGTVTLFFGFDPSIATPGRVRSVTDRYGNTQTYDWQNVGGVDQLTSVKDSYGRMIEYAYYGPESGYLLQQITDFLGRQLNFQYDQFSHLVAVITPSVNQAAQGNTYPGGTAYVFQYDVNNPRPDRRDDLVKIWFPNEATPFIDAATRTVDVQQVYQLATPRYTVVYGQDPTDEDFYGRVVQETVGDPANGIGGTYQYLYSASPSMVNPFASDPDDNELHSRCVVTDRNDNQTIYDFNMAGMPVRTEVVRSRSKIDIPSLSTTYVTWTSYNPRNQPKVVIYPLGNSVEYSYEDGNVTGLGLYNPRVGLLLSRTQLYNNNYGISPSLPASPGTSDTSPTEPTDQTQLTELYFYDPLFNQQCAMVERRGNPINSSNDYFVPQNGGTTTANQSRYATLTFYDYQKDQPSSVEGDTNLQNQLGLTSAQITSLIDFVGNQMTTAGLSSGFQMNLGDINGDGTGDGDSSTLPYAKPLGNVVKVQHPEVTLVQSGSSSDWSPNQPRLELFTNNAAGQTTTHTDPEGNLTVYVRYPYNDPEGNGGLTDANPGSIGAKQYGRLKEVHVDANPDHVLSLLGWSSGTQSDADLVDFVPNIITRSNTTTYADLVTRHEGGSGASGSGCAACAYDALGNPLAQTDPRGFTIRLDRNELGEVYRTISPQPYNFLVEISFDANRNTTRVDTEDQQPAYDSADPSSACYAQFSPSGSGGTAHVPMQPGRGGSVRPGWFTNLYYFDLLDNKFEDNIDATGSTPASLITKYLYDPNQNLIQIIKPEGNIVEFDYDERNLRIATRVGMVPGGEPGSITITPYDANGNAMATIGPADRDGLNSEVATIADAFRSGTALTHTGDLTANTFDGFNRLISTTDPLGNVVNPFYDPDGRVIYQATTGADGFDHAGVLLASSETRYDEAGRQYEAQQNVFLGVGSGVSLPSGRSVTHTGGGLAANSTADDHNGTVTLTSGGSSYVLTRTLYDNSGRTTGMLADNMAPPTIVYDGANRLIQTTDAMGNVVQNVFDQGGNVILSTRTEVCTITPGMPTEIFQSAMLYDSLNRLVLQAQQGADGTLDLNILNCGSDAMWQVPSDTIIRRYGYDSRGNRVLMIDPKGNTSLTVFDGASRRIQIQQHLRIAGQGSNPPVANQSNAALTLSSQLPPATGSLLPAASACIVTTMILDGNGRLTQLIDDRGDITLFQYDTIDRQTVMTFHDGSTRTNLYDEAGDVLTYTDENGSVFDNSFDALGRKISDSISPAVGVAGHSGTGVDGTIAQAFTYDGLSRITDSTDSSSSGDVAEVKLFYDSLSRVLEESQSYTSVTARNVTNTAFTSYPVTMFQFPYGRELQNTYDLLYRRTVAFDYTNYFNVAIWRFFGPSRVAEVTLGNGLICTWMNNARTNSAVQPSVANPAWGDQSSDRLGYDGAGRPITKRYFTGGLDEFNHYVDTTALVGFTTEYDLASNKFYERELHCEERSHLYEPFSNGSPTGGYDSLSRLRQYKRGVLASDDGFGGNGGGSVATAIALPGTDTMRTYDLDSLGNWRRTNFTLVSAPETTQTVQEVRQHNGLNEITRIQDTNSATGTSQLDFAYDHGNNASNTDPNIAARGNGNLVNDGTRYYIWDALNRLIAVYKDPSTTPSSSTQIGGYVYDAMNRRIRKMVLNNGLTGDLTNGTTDCLYSGWRCIEERDGSNTTTLQYIWGIYLDELIQLYAYGDFGSEPLPPGAYYPLQDLLYRTTALTNTIPAETPVIVEAYDTDAYGKTLIFNAPGTGSNWWANNATTANYPACTFIFTGQRFDAETQVYYYKMRNYLSILGRFASRDPESYSAGASLFQYALSNPVLLVDPTGRLFDCPDLCSPVGKTRNFRFLGVGLRPGDKQGNPEALEAAKGALANAELLNHFANVASIAVSATQGAIDAVLAVIDSAFDEGRGIGVTDAMAEMMKAWDSAAIARSGVSMFINLSYQVCDRRRCCFFSEQNDWIDDSGWYKCTRGSLNEFGAFAPNDAAGMARNLKPCIQDALKALILEAQQNAGKIIR
jgi:RHS repeat-associated protein